MNHEYAPRRVTASHPDFNDLNTWMTAIAELTNPQCHFNLKDMTREEQLELLDEAYEQMEKYFEGGAIADWLAQQPFIKDFNK